MKKFLVVSLLFALPIIAYLFFASGVNNFARLPVLTEDVKSLEAFRDIDGEKVSFEGNINILGFYGENPEDYAGNTYILGSKIYDNFYKFKDFQVLIVATEGSEDEARELMAQMKDFTNPLKWKFIFGEPAEIEQLFSSLGTDMELQEDYSTKTVFIVDKKGHLRGRKQDEDEGLLYGYDSSSVAELDDKMNDDVKVILAEYRLELKKYNSEIKN